MTVEMVLPQHLDMQTFTDYLMNSLNNRSNHYFLAVYTQIAGRIPMSGTARILTDISEEVFYSSLKTLMDSDHAITIPHRFYIAELYYAAVGLGKLKFDLDKNESILTHSMLDKAWLRMFSRAETPINFVTSGYIAATFGLVFGKPMHSYIVNEQKSIACGEPVSVFKILRREDVSQAPPDNFNDWHVSRDGSYSQGIYNQQNTKSTASLTNMIDSKALRALRNCEILRDFKTCPAG